MPTLRTGYPVTVVVATIVTAACFTTDVARADTVYTSNIFYNTVRSITASGSSGVFATLPSYPGSSGYAWNYGLAFDSFGNLFGGQAGPNFSPMIYKLDASGAYSVFGTGTGTSLYRSVAVDNDGNVFASLPGTGVVKYTPAGIGSVYSTADVGSLACDPFGNLYAKSQTDNRLLKVLPSGSTQTIYSNLGGNAITTDAAGVVYGAWGDGVMRITPSGSASMYATGLGSVVSLAFGSQGNLYVGTAFDSPNKVFVVSPAGTASLLSDVGLNPFGLAVRRGTSIDTVTSGTVSVPSGQQYNVTTANGGQIDASQGTAQIGTLAGATLSTGGGGATVTTLSSGTIITSGGSISTQGGTFTGSITGNGGLTMTGTGTLVLSSSSSYTGNTVINAGTVEITVGDAIGSAPIRIANNGRFRAVAGVAVANPVIVTSTGATYEHVLGGSDTPANLAPVSNTITTADIVAGDPASTTVTSNFNGNGSVTLHGLDGTRFLMVLDMDGYIPDDATTSNYYLGWWDGAANAGAGGWVNAVQGNHGTAGALAGAYTMGYQQFLTSHGGWNGTTMLGAFGLDLANDQVWAVIDHNSDFGVTANGILVVPEPSTVVLAISAMTVARWWPRRRTRRAPVPIVT
ncbi:MAG: autotransporter-associated beta strand repeat-containing protein [Planctomycetia bacterium]